MFSRPERWRTAPARAATAPARSVAARVVRAGAGVAAEDVRERRGGVVVGAIAPLGAAATVESKAARRVLVDVIGVLQGKSGRPHSSQGMCRVIPQ